MTPLGKKRASAAFAAAFGRHIASTTISEMASVDPRRRPALLRNAINRILEIQTPIGGQYPVEPAIDSFAEIVCVAFAQTPIMAMRGLRSTSKARMALDARRAAAWIPGPTSSLENLKRPGEVRPKETKRR